MTQTITPKEWVLIILGGLFVVVLLHCFIRGLILGIRDIPLHIRSLSHKTPEDWYVPWNAWTKRDEALKSYLSEHPEFDTPDFHERTRRIDKLFKRTMVILVILLVLMGVVAGS